MFAGVDAEAGDTVADELVHEFPDFPSDVVSALVQVVQSNQFAVAHLEGRWDIQEKWLPLHCKYLICRLLTRSLGLHL